MKCHVAVLSALLCFGLVASTAVVGQDHTRDNFESYTSGDPIDGVNSWSGWDNLPAFAGIADNAQAKGGSSISMRIDPGADAVQEYELNGELGCWTICADSYLASGSVGQQFFILLNTYNIDPDPKNWSMQFHMDNDNGIAEDQGATPGGQQVPLVYDEWVPIVVCIDLDNDLHSACYNGEFVIENKSWTEGTSGGGALDIDALDLFGNGATAMWYDNVRLYQGKAHKIASGSLVEGFGEVNDFNAACGFDDVYWEFHGATLFFQITDPVAQFKTCIVTKQDTSTVSEIRVEVEGSRHAPTGTLFLRAVLCHPTDPNLNEPLQGTMALPDTDAMGTFNYTGSNHSDFFDQDGKLNILFELIQTSGAPNTRARIDEVIVHVK